MRQYDVLVIGAGAAGLIAANEIALTGRKVGVIEAKEKCGGRIQTFYTNERYPMEEGAEFVHGNLPLTMQLLEKAGAKAIKVSGSIWQKKDGLLQEQGDFIEDYSALKKTFKKLEEDISVEDFINQHLNEEKYEDLRFSLRNYAEGYYAANLNKASTSAMRDELNNTDEEQFRIDGGYMQLAIYLEDQCRQHGVQFIYSQAVSQLHWKKDEVEAITGTNSFKAKKVLITASIGVLQSGAIVFVPALPEKNDALQQLGFGHVRKINFEFEDRFWQNRELTNDKNLDDLSFLFSEEVIPTWWTQHPQKENVLTGWLGGPKAERLQAGDESFVNKALHSLGAIFNLDAVHLYQKLITAKFYDWTADPHFRGAYSYAVINGEKYMNEVLQPVENTLYIAGEGLHHGAQIGTVEAALVSGRNVAHRLIAEF